MNLSDAAPFLALALLFAMYLAGGSILRRMRRVSDGRSCWCGYSTEGLVGNTCPECARMVLVERTPR